MDRYPRSEEQNNLGTFALVMGIWIELFHLGRIVSLIEPVAWVGATPIVVVAT